MKRYCYIKHFFLFLLVFIFSFNEKALAQLLTVKRTPYNLVTNTLLGTGITISNVKFNGVTSTATTTAKYNNIGFFKGTTNIGLDSGIIMTTGTILSGSSGPQGPNNSGSSGVDNSLPGDNDLDALTALTGGSTTTHNKAILEFDFIPSYDTVKFRYVFGSEEYPEFVNSVNDVFGFFIRGPGITGSFSLNSKNIALIPNTTAPITINSVNNGNNNSGPCTNCAYYIDNQTIPGTTIQYDGFTSALTAISHVQCGQTYHIKMAIADASDGIYDSGVFLEALSFSSPVVTISSAVALGGAGHSGTSGDTVLYEGCGNAVLDFKRGGNISIADTVHFTITGTAGIGTDFLSIPDSVVFAAGQNHATVTLQAIEDNTIEGLESVIFTPINVNPNSCSTNLTKPFALYISDVTPIVAVASQDSSIICPNQNSTIDVTVTGGMPGYSYSWDQGIGLGKRHTVSPAVTTIYTVTVTDTCGTHISTANVTITVDPYTPVVATASADTKLYCPFESTQISAQGSGGAAYYKYSWNNGGGIGQTVTVAPAVTTLYTVTVTDTCGNSAKDDVIVEVVPYPSLKIGVSKDTTVCKFEPVTLLSKGIDGHGPYTYTWTNGVWNDSAYTVSSDQNKSYIITVTDNCGYTKTDTVAVFISIPIARFGYNFDSSILTQFLDSSEKNIVNYFWDFGDNTFSTEYNPSHEYATSSLHLVKLIVTNDLGCKDSVTETVFPPLLIYLPSSFTPNGDGKNDYYEASGVGVSKFEMSIFNRWGELIYHSNNVSDKWDAAGLSDGIYIYQINAKGLDNKTLNKSGTITIIR